MTILNLCIIPIKTYYNISDFQIQLISALLFLGVVLGSLVSGWFSKIIGRVAILQVSLLLVLISHLLMAISVNVWMFSFQRIIIGFGLGIIIPISMNIFCEYLPYKYRGFFNMFSWCFFSFGMMLNGIVMYFEIPNLEISKLKRIFVIQTIFPTISFLCSIFFLYDSPRNLIVHNKIEKGFDILKSMNQGQDLTEEEKNTIICEIVTEENFCITGTI